uniref:DUF2125 domain-containing protein n=1 Tax=Phenylobacterium glaciei TaxID=2803784 RepID=A0A974P4R0_9CAUL|nr:DUF2125 domain-containing protein [Phenylobacterium glaciei]
MERPHPGRLSLPPGRGADRRPHPRARRLGYRHTETGGRGLPLFAWPLDQRGARGPDPDPAHRRPGGGARRTAAGQPERRGQAPPAFSFEGRKLTFAPGAGAQPFGLSAADKVELHLRPGPDDQGAILFKVENGKAQLSGLFAQLAGDKPISIVWDSILTKMSGFKGQTWPAAVRAWSTSGGLIQVKQAGVTAGDALIGAQSGQLGVGYDGRLVGSMDVTLRQAPRALAAMAASGTLPPETALAAAAVAVAREDSASVARATLTFEAGRMTLGPVAVGASPRVY